MEFFQNKIRKTNDESKNNINYLSFMENMKEESLKNDVSKLKVLYLKNLSFCTFNQSKSQDKNLKPDKNFV